MVEKLLSMQGQFKLLHNITVGQSLKATTDRSGQKGFARGAFILHLDEIQFDA